MHRPFSSAASVASSSAVGARADRGGPFAGLVVCVTGLSKGARLLPLEIRLMNVARGRLFDWCLVFLGGCRGEGSGEGGDGAAGGRVQWEPAPQMHAPGGSDILHLICFCFSSSICLFPQIRMPRFLNTQHSFTGRKFEHALKHGPRNGLFLATLGWFVDCVRRNCKFILHDRFFILNFDLMLLAVVLIICYFECCSEVG
jgi:hypothetical protein